MNIDSIVKHLDWEQYYNPNFEWDNDNFYLNNQLSKEFIEEFKDKVNWWAISFYQVLSEDFIREFKDKVKWDCISFRQTLSESFIEEFQDYVHWGCIYQTQHLSREFTEKWYHKLIYKESNEY